MEIFDYLDKRIHKEEKEETEYFLTYEYHAHKWMGASIGGKIYTIKGTKKDIIDVLKELWLYESELKTVTLQNKATKLEDYKAYPINSIEDFLNKGEWP